MMATLISVWMASSLFHTISGCILSSTPEEVTGYTGGSVVLPCSCTDVQEKPEHLRWLFTEYTIEIVNEAQRDPRYRDRLQVLNTDSPGNLSVLLLHLTESDAGSYRCEVDGYSFKDIKLSVKGVPDTTIQTTTQPHLGGKSEDKLENQGLSNSISLSQYVTIVVFAIVTCCAVCVGVIIYCRRKRKKFADMECRGQNEVGVMGPEEKDADSVTYSTVIHSKAVNKTKRQEISNGGTEYAAIKLHVSS